MAKIAVILVLPIEYHTSSMLRCRTIISALADMGHEVTCYCPNPDKNNKYFSEQTVDIPRLKLYRYGGKAWSEKQSEIERKKNRSIKFMIKNVALNMFRKIDIFGSALMYLPEKKHISDNILKGKHDILLSFSDPKPAHIIGRYCKHQNPHITYIQQWGDPLASDTTSKTVLPVWIRKWIENTLIKPANKVCYVSPITLKTQKELFPYQAHKMFFLPTPSLSYDQKNRDQGKLTLGYFGSYHSIARNILPFYEAAKLNQSVDFLIIGDSDIELKSTDNIKVIQRIPPEELKMYMQKIDVIVCLMNSKGNQIPGKVYHDASSEKDILVIKDGEYGDDIQAFFEKYDHYTFADNTVDSINSAIMRYITSGVPIRKPVEDFQASNVAKKLID